MEIHNTRFSGSVGEIKQRTRMEVYWAAVLDKVGREGLRRWLLRRSCWGTTRVSVEQREHLDQREVLSLLVIPLGRVD